MDGEIWVTKTTAASNNDKHSLFMIF